MTLTWFRQGSNEFERLDTFIDEKNSLVDVPEELLILIRTDSAFM